MSKKFKTRNAKYKSAVCGFVAIAASFAMFASACAETPTTSDDDNNTTSTRVDEQTLKNGNFEFFEDNDGSYLLGTPDNWSSGTGSGASSSDSGSGVLNTTAANWNRLTDPELPQKIWDNLALDSDDENYVNYNGDPFDLPLRDPASAITENEDDDSDDVTDDYIFDSEAEYINNPYTHEYRMDSDGTTLLNANGDTVTYYTDDKGNYYTSEELTEESKLETNVLMIHNFVDDDLQGTQTYYSSSTTLTLEANTAAKLSVWVKTSDLYFGSNNDKRTGVTQDRGAYIEVSQTVGGTTLDAFRIENINTEELNPYYEDTDTWKNGNNGWVQYTVYISACNYAETTITLTVGLGEASNNTVEGYAFFDDIEYTKYLDTGEMTEDPDNSDWADVTDETTCTLLYEGEDKIYRVDRETINKGTVNEQVVEHYSNYNTFYLDLTAENESVPVSLASDNLSAGLTVDSENYTTSRGNVNLEGSITQSKHDGDVYLATAIRTNSNYDSNGFNISNDVIANLSVTSASSWTSAIGSIAGSDTESEIDEALKTAVDLPGAESGVSTLLMFSARGAAYESVISDDSFAISGGEYKIVTFWVKTSDLDGKTTASITVRQKDKDSNSASIEVDSTTIAEVTINETENVYNGWVQCYALIANELDSGDEEQQFEIVVNYGPTDIKDTALTSFYPGWIAVTNISVLTVDETAFGYADTSTRAASITITEESETSDNYFDDAYGSSNNIETQITRPSNYTGVNGGSALVQSAEVDVSENQEFHTPNSYEYAGLINKDYREAYAQTYAELLSDGTYLSSPIAALFGSEETWNEVLGSANQPLLIINTVRQIADKTVNTYGFYGANSTVSSDSYTAVSVKVKVSQGAVATVYLVDPTDKNTLRFGTPRYTFWYDNDGNVLKGEPDEDWNREQQRENIAYTLRSDGLYEDENGNLYANLYNLEREYYDEGADYYNAQHVSVPFDELVDGEIYYADEDLTRYANHNLVTTSGERVYRYVSGIEDTQLTYLYFVNDEPDESKVVKAFDTSVATPRYTEQESSPYSFTIDAINNPELADKWITVSFFIHTGSESKSYRLELWSGTRDTEYTDGVEEGSYVLFDYSSISLDADTYSSLLSHYSDNIIEYYRDALIEKDPTIVFDSNEEDIAYYEKLAEDKGLNLEDLIYDYEAQYYTYTLYDSANYVPFNSETAEEGETGYNYSYSEYTEQLAVLKVDDTLNDQGDVKSTAMLGMFIDYSTLDNSITTSSTPDDSEDEDTTTAPADETNVWLLASSIVMVIAILIAIAVLILRDMRKKFKIRRKAGKNTYNYKKNRRYVRTYVKEHGVQPVSPTDGEAPVEPGTDGGQSADVQPGETPAENEGESTESDGGEQPDGENN